jgi:iron(III) transport system substrate-binding protein
MGACGSTAGPAATGTSTTGTTASSTTVSSTATASSSASTSAAATSTTEEPLDPSALVIYNAQHENLTQAWADEFSKTNGGVKVQLRNGSDLEMANQIVAEGDASPADVFITENSPGMNLVEGAGLFDSIDPDTLSQIPSQYSPSTGKWVGR